MIEPDVTPWQALTHDQKRTAVRQAVELDNLTYARAAERLGTTRTAIAGVVERARRSPAPIVSNSGLRYGGDHGLRKKSAAKKAKPKHAGFHKFVALPELPKIEPAIVRADAWQALPGSSPVALEAHVNGCRFPTGDDRPFLSCNLPVKDGSVYCPAHDDLCYRDLPVRRDIRKDSR